MLKTLKLAATPLRHPILSFVAVAAVAVATVGEQITPVKRAMDHIASLVTGDELAAFRPGVTSDPAKEIEFLRSLEERVAPDLSRARALLNKRRAEIEYVRELASFLECRLSPEEQEKLRALAAQDDEDAELPEDISTTGKTWLAYQVRIGAFEEELEQLMLLESRVAGLNERLEQRRQETQGLVAEPAVALSGSDSPATRTADMAEVESLLSDAHEQLFTALYTISPSLVAQD